MPILTGLTVLALVTWLLWERLRPAFEHRGSSSRLWRNALMGVVGFGATFLIVTPTSLGAAAIGPAWRESWPMWLRLGTDILLLEFYLYWWHRANHELPLLWRFHRVHHYDEFLDVTTVLRFHPGEVVFSAFVRGVWVLALDISIPAILIFDALVVIFAGFHHSNVGLSASADKALRRLIVSPHHHRVHHIPERQFTDSNYGTLFTFWDRMFGTFKEAPTKGNYGVEGAQDKRIGKLMTDPFTSPSHGS